jgi:hypothetical protein
VAVGGSLPRAATRGLLGFLATEPSTAQANIDNFDAMYDEDWRR